LLRDGISTLMSAVGRCLVLLSGSCAGISCRSAQADRAQQVKAAIVRRSVFTTLILSGGAVGWLARLAALVPPPRVHLTRFHGVLAAHAALRAAITPAGRGTGARKRAAEAERPAGGGADGLARSTCAAAGVAIVTRLVEGLVFSRASDGVLRGMRRAAHVGRVPRLKILRRRRMCRRFCHHHAPATLTQWRLCVLPLTMEGWFKALIRRTS
jgi:hypothetical protein